MHETHTQSFVCELILTHKYLYMSTNSHTNKRAREQTHVREYKLMYVSTNSRTNICTHAHMCL